MMTQHFSNFVQFNAALQEARPFLVAKKVGDGIAYFTGSKRVIRLAERVRSQGVYLVRSATERATKTKLRETFVGSLVEFMSIVDQEVAVASGGDLEFLGRGDRGSRNTTLAVHPHSAQAVTAIKDFVFSQETEPEPGQSGQIYRWLISDAGVCVGVYIGLTKVANPKTRIARYRSNVLGIQRSEPYSKKDPSGYRKVHHALVAALQAGHQITLTWLGSPPKGMSLKAFESQQIALHKSYGFASHQLNEAQ